MKLLLYDGTCNLCHWAVQWVKKHAVVSNFQFESLESDFAKQLIEKYPNLTSVDSIVFMDESGLYIKSAAILRIAGYLKFPWNLLQVFKIFPVFISDALYSWVAKSRKKWFGQRDACVL